MSLSAGYRFFFTKYSFKSIVPHTNLDLLLYVYVLSKKIHLYTLFSKNIHSMDCTSYKSSFIIVHVLAVVYISFIEYVFCIVSFSEKSNTFFDIFGVDLFHFHIFVQK